MTDKVYIASTNMATVVCPKCQKSKTVDVSKFVKVDKIVKVKLKCPCGYANTYLLEKRKRHRKETNLPGCYNRYLDGKQVGGGLMVVKDLSTIGMKLQVNADHNLDVGDVVLVEFHTDDMQRALIKKKVIVRNIKGQIIGTEFAPTEGIDKALGFYLFS